MILKDHDDDHHHRHDEDEDDDDDDDDDDSEDADAYLSLCCLIIGPGHFARTLTRCLFL
jgi:hypothetical protein